MAANVKLTGNDPVSDQRLSHVSHHVVSRVRKQFATGPLGLSDNQYDNIEEDAQYAERRNYEVISHQSQSIHTFALLAVRLICSFGCPNIKMDTIHNVILFTGTSTMLHTAKPIL